MFNWIFLTLNTASLLWTNLPSLAYHCGNAAATLSNEMSDICMCTQCVLRYTDLHLVQIQQRVELPQFFWIFNIFEQLIMIIYCLPMTLNFMCTCSMSWIYFVWRNIGVEKDSRATMLQSNISVMLKHLHTCTFTMASNPRFGLRVSLSHIFANYI